MCLFGSGAAPVSGGSRAAGSDPLKVESILQLRCFFPKKKHLPKSTGFQDKVSPCSGGVVGPFAAYTVQKTTFLSVFECFPACCDDYKGGGTWPQTEN